MEVATLLTAYNQDVQKYIERPSTSKTKAIINEIKENALSEGLSFNRFFPTNTKKYRVLNYIVYLTSVGGIGTIACKTLAEKVGASIRTVKEAVSNLKKLGCFIVGGLANGANKYIFVYKNHNNFNEILANVFYINALPTAPQIAHLENTKTTDTQGLEEGKTDSIYNYPSLSKQEKDNIRDSIENDVKEATKQSERIEEYVTNPYQKLLYENIITNKHIHNKIKQDASVIALRAGSNCSEKTYGIALKSVAKVDKFLYFDGVAESVPALFERIYTDRIKYCAYYTTEPSKPKRDTSYLHNWLE